MGRRTHQTYLTPAKIEDLFAATKEHFNFSPDVRSASRSYTASLSREISKLCANAGFKRSAWAVRDFMPKYSRRVIAFSL